jgi:hypothetical protein
MKNLTPKDHAEAVATFRHAVIGPLCARELSHGELAEMLREIASTRVRPPGSKVAKTYSVPTLERWLYAYRQGGLPALQPRVRGDRGRGRHLTGSCSQTAPRGSPCDTRCIDGTTCTQRASRGLRLAHDLAAAAVPDYAARWITKWPPGGSVLSCR